MLRMRTEKRGRASWQYASVLVRFIEHQLMYHWCKWRDVIARGKLSTERACFTGQAKDKVRFLWGLLRWREAVNQRLASRQLAHLVGKVKARGICNWGYLRWHEEVTLRLTVRTLATAVQHESFSALVETRRFLGLILKVHHSAVLLAAEFPVVARLLLGHTVGKLLLWRCKKYEATLNGWRCNCFKDKYRRSLPWDFYLLTSLILHGFREHKRRTALDKKLARVKEPYPYPKSPTVPQTFTSRNSCEGYRST